MAWMWLGIALTVLSAFQVLPLVTSGRLRFGRAGLPLASALAAVVLGEVVVASAIPSSGGWRYAALIAEGEAASLVVAYLAVASHPTRLFPGGRLAAARRASLALAMRSRLWRVASSLGRPVPALVIFSAAVVSWQLVVPWVAAAHSVVAREAYVVASFLVALPFWCHVFPLSNRPVLEPGPRAGYVGAAAMIANVANVVQLSGLPVVAKASVPSQALLGPRLASAMLLTGASGFLALMLIFLVIRWLHSDHEAHPPKPSHRAPIEQRKDRHAQARRRARYGRAAGAGEVVPLWPVLPEEPGQVPKKGIS